MSIFRGRYEEALDSYRKVSELSGTPFESNPFVQVVYFLLGDKDKGKELIDSTLEHKDEIESSYKQIAILYAYLGDKDKAFE